MLHNSNEEFIDQGFWGLGNVCGDSHTYRNLAIEHGIQSMNINLRSALDRNKRPSYFDNACWALSNICRTKPYPPLNSILETIVMFVEILGRYGDLSNEVVKDISWSLVHNLNEEVSELIINSNAINLLLSLVKYQ
jgi:importin subunit alpha-6/7